MVKTNVTTRSLSATLRRMMTNAKNDPIILDSMTGFNYGPEKHDEGLQLSEMIDAIRTKVDTLQADKNEASKEVKEQFQHGFQYYVDQVKLARKVFSKNSPYYSSLNLNGSRIRSIDGYRSQAMKFYRVALDEPNISAALEAEFNITQEALQEGIRKIEDMEQAIQKAKNTDADSQVAAAEEAHIVEQSKKWRSKYLTVAKQALKDKPQLLEKLEVVVE